MAQPKKYSATLLLVILVTLPFLLVAGLVFQYRWEQREHHLAMAEDLSLFRTGMAVIAPLERVRDFSPAVGRWPLPPLEERWRGAQELTGQRLQALLDQSVSDRVAGLPDQTRGLVRDWRELRPLSDRALDQQGAAAIFDSVEQVNEHLYRTLAAVLYMSDLAAETRPRPTEALSLTLTGIYELRLDLGIIRAVGLYAAAGDGQLGEEDHRRLTRAVSRLGERLLQVEGQAQALAARADDDRLRQHWRNLRAELQDYLAWAEAGLVRPETVTLTWQEVVAESGARQAALNSFDEFLLDLAERLADRAADHGDLVTAWIVAGLLLLYLAVLAASLIFMRVAGRAIRGRAEVRAKSQFLARMSHEIRTPLNGVLGLAELLRETNPSPRQQDYIGLIENAGRTLNTLVNDVLDYSKLEAGKLELEAEDFDPAALVIDCAHMFSLPASDNGDLVLVDVDPNLPAVVSGDAPRLRQVLTNLVSNAVKFTRHGWVRVSARCLSLNDDRAVIRFAVEDNGLGMSKDEQRRLFQHFSQASASVSRRFGGTGLGLSISQELVRLMGGDIQLRSAPGQGSCFHFILTVPMVTPPVPMPEPTREPALVWDQSGNLKALLCRDPRFAHVTVVTDLNGVRDALARSPVTHLLVHGVTDGVQLDQGLRPARQRGTGFRPVLLCGMRESGEVVMRDDITLVRRAVLTVAELQQLLSDDGPGRVPLIAQREPEPAHGGLRVLVAEDNPVNQMVTRGYLERLGVPAPVLGDDGHQALEHFRAGGGAYRLVLMDLDMPVMDGFESARRMRALEQKNGWRPAVILALSAHIMPEYAKRIREVGMDGQLIKPLTLSAMQAALHQYLSAP
ncbi:hybrid sensor histidine kinase/response regulator [Alloalcanivorax gelatiniphagus]|uniref:histidine kinase n=1 Tax=Alloalcanivorax gelatiniphagus TaxID=1194167 RepID=A0ABY2XPF9_9GAMM|nr:ATP-binding protein [Alloalcanivorax gelatiniphagus]TMW14474.1 response regulator [Alloalcanivorax gelatiniphagus]